MLPGGLRQPVLHHRHRLTETCLTETTAAPGASWVSPTLTQSACSTQASFPSAANSLEPKRTSPLGSAKSFTDGRYPW